MNGDALVELAIASYCGLVAFGLVPVSKNPEKNKEWLVKHGTLLKLAAVIFAFLGMSSLFRAGS